MKTGNSKSSHSHILSLNVTDKIYLQRCKRVFHYRILAFTIHGKT